MAVLFNVFALFVANVITHPPLVSLGFTGVNTLESLTVFMICRLFIRNRKLDLENGRMAMLFVVSTLIGGVLGGLTGTLFASSAFDSGSTFVPLIFIKWFSSDSLGLIMVVPFMLSLRRPAVCLRYIRLRPFRCAVGFVGLILTVVQALLLPRLTTYTTFFTYETYMNFSYYFGFSLVLLVGGSLGMFGFSAATLALGITAVCNLVLLPERPSNPVEMDKFNAYTVHLLFELQIFLTALLMSRYADDETTNIVHSLYSLTFTVIQSDKRNAILELKKARLMAENANRQKSSFMSFLCHELRNPLHAVANMVHFLEETKLSEEQAELSEAIRISTKYMSDLVNDVLDEGKFEAGKVTLEQLPVDLAALLRTFFIPLKEQMRTKNIEVAGVGRKREY